MTSTNATMNVEGDWFKLNVDASGYYIVNYDVKNWKRIIKQLSEDHRVFSGLDRASIIKDTFTMAEEGLLPFEIALGATKYLEKVSFLSIFLNRCRTFQCYIEGVIFSSIFITWIYVWRVCILPLCLWIEGLKES